MGRKSEKTGRGKIEKRGKGRKREGGKQRVAGKVKKEEEDGRRNERRM